MFFISSSFKLADEHRENLAYIHAQLFLCGEEAYKVFDGSYLSGVIRLYIQENTLEK